MIRSPALPTLLAFVALNLPAGFAAESGDASSWEKIDQTDGITVYRKEVAGSPIVAFKGEGLIDAPLSRVAAVLFDRNRVSEWVDGFKDGRVLRETSARDFVVYSHISTPFVMKDRDFVSHSKIEVDERTNTVVQHLKATTDPAAPETTYVRGELIDSTFTMKLIPGGRQTFLIAEIHADPKGSVAKWVVNRFQEKWPSNTIQAIRRQVAKPDVKPDPSYENVTR